jgi:hypothetical protein
MLEVSDRLLAGFLADSLMIISSNFWLYSWNSLPGLRLFGVRLSSACLFLGPAALQRAVKAQIHGIPSSVFLTKKHSKNINKTAHLSGGIPRNGLQMFPANLPSSSSHSKPSFHTIPSKIPQIYEGKQTIYLFLIELSKHCKWWKPKRNFWNSRSIFLKMFNGWKWLKLANLSESTHKFDENSTWCHG